MLLRINDIFYSIQGEGVNAGRAAVFVRLAGCNRRCDFCDTAFTDYREMTVDDVISEVSVLTAAAGCRLLILTGGEPAMQIDENVVNAFHAAGYVVAIETNGSLPLPPGIDWVTVSPKGDTVVRRCDELKCVFTDAASVSDRGIVADHYLLQPCDTGDPERNRLILQACVEYIKERPQWRLSLQTHKMAGFK